MTINIQQPSNGYVIEYDKALEYEDLQQDINWTAKEIDVDADINDLRVHATEAESHGILTVLKLFTEYERQAGEEYWGKKFKRLYPRVEFQRMGAQFAQIELCVHAPFYNLINDALFLNTPEFYNAWKDDPVLTERMDFIGRYISRNDYHGLLSLAAFSMVEGAVLYSSFAFLKSFKKQGKNLIPNIVSGINFSVRDENLHSEGGAWVYRQTLTEVLEQDPYFDIAELETAIIDAAKALYEHECYIVDMIFEQGEISGITSEQLKSFVGHRINVCLSQVNIKPIYDESDEEIKSWFYEDIVGARSTDHFATLSSNYSRNWKEQQFTWKLPND